MQKVYIGFGSNLGDSLLILQKAWQVLGEHAAVETVSFSSPYKTEPVAMESSNWFVNAVGGVITSLSPMELLDILLRIEKDFGRVRLESASGYQDRILDLDLLLFADKIFNFPDLIIPHPHLHGRLFVLAPFAELEPQVFHPVLKCSMIELYRDLLSRPDQPSLEKSSWPILF